MDIIEKQNLAQKCEAKLPTLECMHKGEKSRNQHFDEKEMALLTHIQFVQIANSYCVHELSVGTGFIYVYPICPFHLMSLGYIVKHIELLIYGLRVVIYTLAP